MMRWRDRTIDPVTITENRDAWQRHGSEYRLGPYRIRVTFIKGALHYHACFCPLGWLPTRDAWFKGRDGAAEARRWCVADAKAHPVPVPVP